MKIDGDHNYVTVYREIFSVPGKEINPNIILLETFTKLKSWDLTLYRLKRLNMPL